MPGTPIADVNKNARVWMFSLGCVANALTDIVYPGTKVTPPPPLPSPKKDRYGKHDISNLKADVNIYLLFNVDSSMDTLERLTS